MYMKESACDTPEQRYLEIPCIVVDTKSMEIFNRESRISVTRRRDLSFAEGVNFSYSLGIVDCQPSQDGNDEHENERKHGQQ
jgi:hypothetical protein